MAGTNIQLGKFSLDNGRFVTVTLFSAKTYVHIRQFRTEGTSVYPTKFGISFLPDRFSRLASIADDVDDQIKRLSSSEEFTYRRHLGGGVFVEVKSGKYCINIRRFFMPDGTTTPIPTKVGISLRLSEWDKFKNIIGEVKKLSPELENAIPCYFSLSHSNQEENASMCRV